MKEVLQQILNGNFTSDTTGLEFTSTKLEISATPAKCYEGSFHVYASSGEKTEGFVTTTDFRMECINCNIDGADTEICYRFRGDLCDDSEVVKGSFCIVSNHGEYYLPFTVTVEWGAITSSMGEIRNLFHFTNLAKSNFEEATNLFYSPEFLRLFHGSDEQYLETYKALSAVPGKPQNLESFLIAINKKQNVEYSARIEKLCVSLTGAEQDGDFVYSQDIEIIRSGWGYTSLRVTCEGDFFRMEKTRLSDEDFSGNVGILRVHIDTAKCKNGRRFGRIILSNPFCRIEIPVEVSSAFSSSKKKTERNRKQLVTQLTMEYIKYRTKTTSPDQWKYATARIVDQMVAMDENDIMAKLFKAQLLITDHRQNEASWILDHAADLIEQKMREIGRNNPLVNLPYCYHWYLTTLVHEEESYVREASRKVESVFKTDQDNWRLAWLELYLPNSFIKTVEHEWELLEREYSYGARSPILYLEAVNRFNNHPTIARKWNPFVKQIICYGARHHFLSGDAMQQVIYLAGHVRDYDSLLCASLKSLYEINPSTELLQEICSQLIKGRRTGSEALEWYRKGIEEEVRVTGLYEAFMAALNLNEQTPLPKSVLIYFSYENRLDYSHMAYIYYYLLRNRRELPEFYQMHQNQMVRFAFDQIEKKHIDRHLAYIYEEILTPEVINRPLALGLSELLFANYVSGALPAYHKALVYQKGCDKPLSYELSKGAGWVCLYGEDACLVLEDDRGNRYVPKTDITLEKLMLPGKYIKTVADFVWDNPHLNLYLCTGENGYSEVKGDNVTRYQHLSESEVLDGNLRKTLAFAAMEYYFQINDNKSLHRNLDRLSVKELSSAQKKEAFRYLILSGREETAKKWLEEYGPYYADAKQLQRVLDSILEDENVTRSPALDAAAVYVFHKGKPDKLVVEYLVKNFDGLCRNLREIWRAAASFDVDRISLDEKILVQLLYSGAFIGEQADIFKEYAREGGDSQVILAYLTQSCYDYFAKEKLTGEDIFRRMLLLHENGQKLHMVCKLAFLKYYSENLQEMDTRVKDAVLSFLQELFDKQIHLGLFESFMDSTLYETEDQLHRFSYLYEEMADRTIIDYHAKPGNIARIHYMLISDKSREQDYVSEQMREVCGGVCFKEFSLFFGESLQYYITEEEGDTSTLTLSDTIQMADARSGGSGAFHIINDMLISEALKDYDTLDVMLEEYSYKQFVSGELFKLM